MKFILFSLTLLFSSQSMARRFVVDVANKNSQSYKAIMSLAVIKDEIRAVEEMANEYDATIKL